MTHTFSPSVTAPPRARAASAALHESRSGGLCVGPAVRTGLLRPPGSSAVMPRGRGLNALRGSLSPKHMLLNSECRGEEGL